MFFSYSRHTFNSTDGLRTDTQNLRGDSRTLGFNQQKNTVTICRNKEAISLVATTTTVHNNH